MIWKIFQLYYNSLQPDSSASLWNWFGVFQTATDCAERIHKVWNYGEEQINKTGVLTDSVNCIPNGAYENEFTTV